ncbi:MAG: hypothetical protein ACT4O3_07445 [Elusimicrobiota bacterium]
MPIETENELNRFSIAVRDFEKAISFLDEAQKNSGNPLTYEAFLISAVIHYTRPFSSNEKSSTSQASSKINISVFNDLTQDELDIHARCIDIRNKAVAHAEWEYYPTRLDAKSGVISSRSYSIILEQFEWGDLQRLAIKLEHQCHHLRANFARDVRLISKS